MVLVSGESSKATKRAVSFGIKKEENRDVLSEFCQSDRVSIPDFLLASSLLLNMPSRSAVEQLVVFLCCVSCPILVLVLLFFSIKYMKYQHQIIMLRRQGMLGLILTTAIMVFIAIQPPSSLLRLGFGDEMTDGLHHLFGWVHAFAAGYLMVFIESVIILRFFLSFSVFFLRKQNIFWRFPFCIPDFG